MTNKENGASDDLSRDEHCALDSLQEEEKAGRKARRRFPLSLFYPKSMRALSEAIEKLANGEPAELPERGVMEELAVKINRTSARLQEQEAVIKRRDDARMEWIRGVSHDIRTPLSMVMGYAALLEEDETLSREQRVSASIIKEQSLRMRELIEDLNLTSKLEYNRQPLRLSAFSPAALLREVVSAAVNAEASDALHELTLLILPDFEALSLFADRNLLRRVFANLVGNAIRHNANGCEIVILAYRRADRAVVRIADDGCGIPEAVAAKVNAFGSFLQEEGDGFCETQDGDVPHIMGLRIAKQIMQAHGGTLLILPDRHTAEVILPLTDEPKDSGHNVKKNLGHIVDQESNKG